MAAYSVPVWRTDLAPGRFPKRFVLNRARPQKHDGEPCGAESLGSIPTARRRERVAALSLVKCKAGSRVPRSRPLPLVHPRSATASGELMKRPGGSRARAGVNGRLSDASSPPRRVRGRLRAAHRFPNPSSNLPVYRPNAELLDRRHR
jgi:hypothetical protein